MIYQSKVHRAYTNIALIKYWGKRHDELFLPMTSSLSLTLDALFTETQVTFDSGLETDCFQLNGESQADVTRISLFLDLFRQVKGIDYRASVTSVNHVPTAAGLASSASAFAALASACHQALGLDWTLETLSTYARQGSGSATRSLFPGFVLWHKGEGVDSSSSYAESLDDGQWDIGMMVVPVDLGQKKISSREAMRRTLETSPYYRMWPQEVAQDLEAILPAIQARDIDTIGAIAEHNAMKMHASMLASYPAINYMQAGSLAVIDRVHELRRAGLSTYYTMDAGPNVKIIAPLSQMDQIRDSLADLVDKDRMIIAKAGPGPEIYESFNQGGRYE